MAAITRDNRRADRIRAAICIALADADHRSMTVAELATALAQRGIVVHGYANKTISDALRWEMQRGHVRKTGRGRFAIGRIPRTTLYYMRERVALYVDDPSRSYFRPHNPTTVGPEVPPSPLLEMLQAWDAKRPRT